MASGNWRRKARFQMGGVVAAQAEMQCQRQQFVARHRVSVGVEAPEHGTIPPTVSEAPMSDQVADLAKRSLALSAEDRARLAEMLLSSLAEEPMSEAEAAWDAEIRRRLEAYDRGEVQAIDAETVFARASAIAR